MLSGEDVFGREGLAGMARNDDCRRCISFSGHVWLLCVDDARQPGRCQVIDVLSALLTGVNMCLPTSIERLAEPRPHDEGLPVPRLPDGFRSPVFCPSGRAGLRLFIL